MKNDRDFTIKVIENVTAYPEWVYVTLGDTGGYLRVEDMRADGYIVISADDEYPVIMHMDEFGKEYFVADAPKTDTAAQAYYLLPKIREAIAQEISISMMVAAARLSAAINHGYVHYEHMVDETDCIRESLSIDLDYDSYIVVEFEDSHNGHNIFDYEDSFSEIEKKYVLDAIRGSIGSDTIPLAVASEIEKIIRKKLDESVEPGDKAVLELYDETWFHPTPVFGSPY